MTLLDTIKAAAEEAGALPETKNFLADELRCREFAEQITKGSGRAEFLLLAGITSEIYENLRRILNGKRIGNENESIVAKRGRIGGLAVVIPEVTEKPKVPENEVNTVQARADEVDRQELRLEKEYYPLVKAWAVEAGYSNCEITGGLIPGFKWENPDLIAVECAVSNLTRSAIFDIASFEVKLRVEPYAIWQAAHYKRFSSEVYIAFAKDEKTIREQNDGRVFELAVELSLGVLAYDSDTGRFREIQSPKRQAAESSKIVEMLENFRKLEGVQSALGNASSEMNGMIGRVLSDALQTIAKK